MQTLDIYSHGFVTEEIIEIAGISTFKCKPEPNNNISRRSDPLSFGRETEKVIHGIFNWRIMK